MTSVQICYHGRRILQIIFDTRDQGWTYAGCQVAMATKFYMVAINNCRSSERNLLHVTHLRPRILSWRLNFWTFSAPLLTTKELIFTEIPGLSPYSKRDKNFDNIQCVNMLRREAVGVRNDPVVCQDYTDSMANEIYTNTECGMVWDQIRVI
jgi:hypothetical protein